MTFDLPITRMTPKAFEQWCRALALSPSTCNYLATIRGRLPVRRVTSRAGNVSGTYPSRKMGVTIQFESHKVELWAILIMDHDPEVLEFFDQPDSFKLRYPGTRLGRCRGITTRPISWSCARGPSVLRSGKLKPSCTGWLSAIPRAISQ